MSFGASQHVAQSQALSFSFPPANMLATRQEWTSMKPQEETLFQGALLVCLTWPCLHANQVNAVALTRLICTLDMSTAHAEMMLSTVNNARLSLRRWQLTVRIAIASNLVLQIPSLQTSLIGCSSFENRNCP
jgi:hypothetical protein